MSEKPKKVRLEDGKLVIEFDKAFDPNKDGEELASVALKISVDLAEIPDEAVDAWKKRKEKK